MRVPKGMHQDLAKSNPPRFPSHWRVTGTLATRADYMWVAYIDTFKTPHKGCMRRMFWPRIHSSYKFEWHPAWGFDIHPNHAHAWRQGILALDRVRHFGTELEAVGTVLHRLEWMNAQVDFCVERPWEGGSVCYSIKRRLTGNSTTLSMRWTADWCYSMLHLWDGLLTKMTEVGAAVPVLYGSKVTTLGGLYDE